MIRITRKRLILGGVALLVLAAIVYLFLPRPLPVQTAVVRRGPLEVTVEEEGTTAVAERYAITSPVSAFVRRIELEEGDVVARGQPVVFLEPPRSPVLDPSARREAEARVQAAEAAAALAEAERARTARLVEVNAATRQQLEQAVSEAERAVADVAAARAALERMDESEVLAVAEVLRAPAAGRVLVVRRESAGQVNPGDTLVVVGNTNQLEVHADVLSQDAVRIRPGTRVQLDQWGGDQLLTAVVRRVEPQGFTEISSLGVEEQRVTVVATLTSPPELWAAGLGAGYRVLARFVIWEGANVLQVPTAALFRSEGGWATFVVQDGRARRRAVRIGQQAGLNTQILAGLRPGEVVIVHPSNEVEDGVRVEGEPELPPDRG